MKVYYWDTGEDDYEDCMLVFIEDINMWLWQPQYRRIGIEVDLTPAAIKELTYIGEL